MKWLLLTLAIVVLSAGIGLGLRKRTPRLSKAVAVLLVIFVLLFGSSAVICWEAPQQPDAQVDFAIVLGAALTNGEPTQELLRRLQTALDWMDTTAQTPLIVSGGGEEDGRTEADVMYGWLAEHGADMSRVLREDRAENTQENISRSLTLARDSGIEGSRVMLVTAEYHQRRARFWARQYGLQPMSCSSETPFLPHVTGTVREVYAFVKSFYRAFR